MFAAIFWDSVMTFVESSVPSSWSWTVRHVLKAGTLSVIVYRLVIVVHAVVTVHISNFFFITPGSSSICSNYNSYNNAFVLNRNSEVKALVPGPSNKLGE